MERVLADADRPEAKEEFAERDSAKHRVPGAAAFGDEIAIQKLMFFHLEFADESGAHAERADLAQVAESVCLLWAQREQDKRRALAELAVGVRFVVSSKDRDD